MMGNLSDRYPARSKVLWIQILCVSLCVITVLSTVVERHEIALSGWGEEVNHDFRTFNVAQDCDWLMA